MPLPSLFPVQRAAASCIRALSLAALLAASAARAADTQADAPGVPPPPPSAGADAPAPASALPLQPRLGGLESRPPADEDAPVTIQATVWRFIPNPDGDVEGFLSTEGLLVRFPPHLSADLVATVHPGDNVRISGRKDAAGNLKAERIDDTKSGRSVVDRPPSPGARPVAPESRNARLSQLSAQGLVAYVTTAPRGEPDGVILADGTVIKLAPPDARQVADLLHTGAQVSAQGYGVRNQYGMALQATAFGAPGKQIRLYDRAAPNP